MVNVFAQGLKNVFGCGSQTANEGADDGGRVFEPCHQEEINQFIQMLF